MTVRTRFAPSPTGYLHVGGARTALFNWLLARKHGGAFVLRIEDTDDARNTEEARQAIFDGMTWLGLGWDGEPIYQSARRATYDAWFEKLVDCDRVYHDEGAWRFRFDRKPITMNDLICGDVTIDYRDASNTPDMVVKRSDGSYVFHFVNVVDDLEMNITHVIRGEDHLMNTPKHLQLIEAFGGEPPQARHIPLILNPDGSKMSKRDAGAAVGDYPRQGFLAAAVANFLALLGWSSKSDDEIFNLDELVERFSLEGVNRAPARFDIEKCKWMNQQHLLAMDATGFAESARPFVESAGFSIPPDFQQVMNAVKEKVRTLAEVPHAAAFLLADDFDYDEDAVAKVRANPAAAGLLATISQAFGRRTAWSSEFANADLAEVARSASVKPGQLMFPLRIALTGRPHGPDLGSIFEVLGKDRCIERINRFGERP